jgi:hypothetical protein
MRRKVADAESNKLACLVELIDGLQRLCKGDATIRTVEVEQLVVVLDNDTS